jgi:hypothetical protein
MIILSSSHKRGFNPFIPAIFSGEGKSMRLIEWNHYKKLSPVFLLINTVFICLLLHSWMHAGEPLANRIYALMGPAVLVYVLCRLRFGRKTIEVRIDKGISRSVAPYQVWLDYISLGAVFFLVGTINAERADNQAMYLIAMGMKIFYSLYAFLPFLNYAVFRLDRKHGGGSGAGIL